MKKKPYSQAELCNNDTCGANEDGEQYFGDE
jgi:hypothetical protein